jgi:hypothetical protein
VCAADKKEHKEQDDDMWEKMEKNAKMQFYILAGIFGAQVLITMLVCWWRGQSSKDVVIRAFDEQFGEQASSERFSLKTKSPVKSDRKRRFSIGGNKKSSP